MEQLVATVDETKKIIKHGHTKTYELLNSGVLKSKKFGNKRLVYISSIREYLGVDQDEAT